MFKNVKTIEVQRFSHRWEATSRQSGYINSLCKQVGCTLEQAIEAMFGMHCIAAFSDRAWLRLTKREASSLIDILKAELAYPSKETIDAQEDRREARKEHYASQWSQTPYDAETALATDEIEQERIISTCPF
jgi:hypothetical protein